LLALKALGAFFFAPKHFPCRTLLGARHIIIEDPFMSRPHQVANLLRLCELLVKLASVKEVTLITRELSDESTGRIESLKRSLVGHGIYLQTEVSSTLHDRRIKTDHGWEINLGRGLDMYKRPDDWASIGVSDFALRPCHQTTIIFHRLGAEPKSVRQSA
jgi:ATP-dependent Lon protease